MTKIFLNNCIASRILLRALAIGKLKHLLTLLLLSLFTHSALAGETRVAPLGPTPTPPLTYDDGDLFIGFRATDRTSDYLINIGPPSQFLNAAPGSSFQVNLGTPGTDLVATFGSDWYTRVDSGTGAKAVLWAVVGGRQVAASGDPANVLYTTNLSQTPWPSRSDTSQSFTTSLVAGLGNAFSGNPPSVNNPKGLVQGVNSFNSYASFQPGGVNSSGISFQTWNPSNEGAPNETLYLNRIAPAACATALGTFTLSGLGTVTFTANSTPVPVGLAGTVTNCSATGSPAVASVTFTLTGSMSGSTTSNGAGAYSFSSLPSGGNFVVTPSKTGLTPGSTGINTVDVVAEQNHALNRVLLTGCRLSAGDVAGTAGINTVDVLAVQAFALGRTIPAQVGNCGKYTFSPTSRSYSSLFCTRTGENYTTFVVGDVATPFVPRPAGGVEQARVTVAEVALPDVAIDESVANVDLQVGTSAIDAKDNLVAFQGDFTFDERVVSFQDQPVQKAGLTAGNWNVSGNVLPGPGPIRTLRVSAFSNDLSPLAGSGVLFELRTAGTSKAGASTSLEWADAPNQFFFVDADLGTHDPGLAAHGGISIEKVAEKDPANR